MRWTDLNFPNTTTTGLACGDSVNAHAQGQWQAGLRERLLRERQRPPCHHHLRRLDTAGPSALAPRACRPLAADAGVDPAAPALRRRAARVSGVRHPLQRGGLRGRTHGRHGRRRTPPGRSAAEVPPRRHDPRGRTRQGAGQRPLCLLPRPEPTRRRRTGEGARRVRPTRRYGRLRRGGVLRPPPRGPARGAPQTPAAGDHARFLGAESRPNRAALGELARLCRVDGERWPLTSMFARRATDIPQPEDILFVEHAW